MAQIQVFYRSILLNEQERQVQLQNQWLPLLITAVRGDAHQIEKVSQHLASLMNQTLS